MEADLATYPNVEKRRNELKKLIRATGTPIAICEKENLERRFARLQECMNQAWDSSQIAYSFKTNYDVARSGVFHAMGAFAEVVSGREYRLARELGYQGKQIVFNGPYKDEESLRAAIQDEAHINVNDQQELVRIVELSNSIRKPVSVGIRLSGTLKPFGHSRFGFSMENGEATRAIKTIERARYVELNGLHSHIYGDTDDERIYAMAATKIAEFARDMVPGFETRIKYLNMGGGFPANTPKPFSRKQWRPKEIKTYVCTITDSLRPFFRPSQTVATLILEPGRYLVNDALILVTSVIHVVTRGGKQMVNTDGSISMVPLTHYRPQVIRAYKNNLERRMGKEIPTVVFGATCRENDLLFEGLFPRVNAGDFLIHFAIGAYNSSLSPSFIFEPPNMVLI